MSSKQFPYLQSVFNDNRFRRRFINKSNKMSTTSNSSNSHSFTNTNNNNYNNYNNDNYNDNNNNNNNNNGEIIKKSIKIDRAPASLEVIRRKIMMAIYAVEKECHIFSERYLRSKDMTTEGWMDGIEQIASRYNKKVSDLEDYKDFEPLINKTSPTTIQIDNDKLTQLRIMCERARVYDYISISLKNDLYNAYVNQLRPYCLSFYQEADGYTLKTIDNYERRIVNWDKDVNVKFNDLDGTLDEMDSYGGTPPGPISKYVKNYSTVYNLMKEMVVKMQDVCEPMKRWVAADAVYTRKIQEEINSYNKKKLELRDVLKGLEVERDRLGLKAKRKSLQANKIERLLTETRDEKRYYKRRETDALHHKENILKERERYWTQLENARHRLKTRKENSPTIFNMLSSTTENCRDQVRRFDGKAEVIDTQIHTLRAEQDRLDKDIWRLKGELETSYKNQQLSSSYLERQNQDMELVLSDIKLHSDRVAVLKRIRELKLHSDTVKKIYHYGYRPGILTQPDDQLDRAFKLASEDVGKDWIWLYHKLPFIPPRDYKSRSQDLEVIDLSNRRLDGGFKLLTVKSLEKWRRLSMNANVSALISTLRKLKKGKTAERIQRQTQYSTPRQRQRKELDINNVDDDNEQEFIIDDDQQRRDDNNDDTDHKNNNMNNSHTNRQVIIEENADTTTEQHVYV